MPRKITTRQCEICGSEFESRTTRRTCSRECQNKLSGFDLVCEICGKEFSHANSRVKGCSTECRKKHKENGIELAHKKNMKARRKLVKKSSKKWRDNLTEKQKEEQKLKNYYWRNNNSDRWKEIKKESRLRNLENAKLNAKRNKARRRKAGDIPDKEDLQKRLNLFNGCCYCTQNDELTLEHLVPISKGGTNIILNLFGACKKCNSSKGNKHFLEWYRIQSFYNLNREYNILQNTLAG